MRIGHGYDVHRVVPGRKLILGGIEVPCEFGLLGHSDADVLTHAVMDALLGAACLGDIGIHFPDTDERYAGASSMGMLADVMGLLREKGYRVTSLDCTVVAQAPKLGSYKEKMRDSLAEAVGLPKERLNLKATTEEGLGFSGRGEGIAAHAVCLLEE